MGWDIENALIDGSTLLWRALSITTVSIVIIFVVSSSCRGGGLMDGNGKKKKNTLARPTPIRLHALDACHLSS